MLTMGNLSNKLHILFRDYLIRKEKERLTPPTYSYSGYRSSSSWLNDKTEHYEGVIYFYEWSDLDRMPQLFYTIGAFDEFLKRSGIYIPNFQWDIIKALDRAFITCKKGKHEILIRASKNMLGEALNKEDSQTVDPQTAYNAVISNPFNPQGERRPPMYSGFPSEWYG